MTAPLAKPGDSEQRRREIAKLQVAESRAMHAPVGQPVYTPPATLTDDHAELYAKARSNGHRRIDNVPLPPEPDDPEWEAPW